MGEEENHPQKVIPESVKVMFANAMDGRLQGFWDRSCGVLCGIPED
ncbi:hypothetical protein [Acidithiobacillus ferrivorans]|uniref:Uncharacterized protein n=1 Tax=Acidithiobacillus ferrivorans TaxID=160808 RepID=A0A7T4WEW6_9PROT|nr:hypothetical protein [Acidithiobacillus ferrivorans]MBN6742055.1 hypothetical protein [Acidithiobacillus sp. MC6.1]QQD73354.1 hypothetical protein H2515_03355 [Acidithiobacillus ferrivorans]